MCLTQPSRGGFKISVGGFAPICDPIGQIAQGVDVIDIVWQSNPASIGGIKENSEAVHLRHIDHIGAIGQCSCAPIHWQKIILPIKLEGFFHLHIHIVPQVNP